jgi:molybdenum cofactor cytidylyltransferase
MDCAEIAVAILAAGESRRFGSDKLMADLDGIPMGLHIARTVASMAFGWRFAICPKGAALVQHFSGFGFEPIENAASELGQSHSLHLAVHGAEATDAKALLVLLADMPFVSEGHITAVVANGGLCASTDGSKPMPPALFPRTCWPELLDTSGDQGARSLLANAILVNAAPRELRDIDVAADLPRPQT